MRTLLLVVSILILVPLTDASKIYHSIRGQDTIKLYVIFNALEVHIHIFQTRVFLVLNLALRCEIDCRSPLCVDWTGCPRLSVFAIDS